MRRLIQLTPPSDLSILGSRIFLSACLMLGVIQIYFGEPLPQLEPLQPISNVPIRIGAALLAISAIWRLGRPIASAHSIILALYWTAVTIVSAAAIEAPGNGLSWVPIAESGLFAIVSLRLAWAKKSRQGQKIAMAVRLASAATLIFFGVIHLSNRDGIAGLIPDWVPATQYWPWVTGTILALAGIGMAIRQLSVAAAMLIAAMFSSWIVLLHVERLMSHPESIFEWTFALTALALTGAILLSADASEHPQNIKGYNDR